MTFFLRSFFLRPVNPELQKLGNFFIAALMLAIPVSTAMTLVLSIIVILLWLASRHFLSLPALLKNNPVALCAVLLYSGFIIGSFYGTASFHDTTLLLLKYRKLLLILILIPFLRETKYRHWIVNAFILGSLLTLLGSYAKDIGIIPNPPNSEGIVAEPTIKSRITHSIILALFSFYCLHKVFDHNRYAALYIAFILLCIHNLYFVVNGRTGQLLFPCLVFLFSLQRLPTKGILFIVFFLTILLSLYFNFGPSENRIITGLSNTQSFLEGHSETKSSMGQRLTFWEHSLELIAEKPLFGHGTGSFAHEYRRIAAGDKIMANNAHNEYLMISVQLGITGLLLYCAFLFSLFWCSFELPANDKWFAQGILFCLAANSLINSSLLDHTEGNWFICLIAFCFASLNKVKSNSRSPC